MIIRIWHGWTSRTNADLYETLLKEEIFVNIHNKSIPGFCGIQLLRHDGENEAEFVTIMKFESLQAVREFAGEDYEQAVVPEKAIALLKRYDPFSRHYLLKEEQ